MPGSDFITVLACQIAVPAMTDCAARDAHLEATARRVSVALRDSDKPVDLVVLPELSTLDYSRACFDHLDELAEPLDGPSSQAWRQVALDHGCFVSFGFARRGAEGVFICQAVAGPDGSLVGHYDKIHLAQFGASMEKEFFARGRHLLTIGIKGFRVAPIICYDIRIPELSRALVLDHGVDVILHSGAYARDPSFPTWHDFARTRAIENQVYLLSLNRAGEAFGRSLFCLPWMDEDHAPVLFAETEEDFRLLTLEKDTLDHARDTYGFLRDRLDTYDLPTG